MTYLWQEMRSRIYIALLFIVSFFSCSSENKNVKIVNNVDINHDRFNKIEITFTDNGILKSKISGDSLIRKKDKYLGTYESEFHKNVMIKFFNKKAEIESIITADYCLINERTKFVHIRGNVYIESIQKDTINAKNLTWDNKTELFTTKDTISISRPNEKINGVGLESNYDFSRYRIYKTVGKAVNKTIKF